VGAQPLLPKVLNPRSRRPGVERAESRAHHVVKSQARSMNSLEPTITPPVQSWVASEVFGSAVHYNVKAILERSLL